MASYWPLKDKKISLKGKKISQLSSAVKTWKKNPPSTLILFIKTFFFRGFSLIFLAKNHTPHVKSMEEDGKLGPKHVTTVELCR